jgi:hypothetical protein
MRILGPWPHPASNFISAPKIMSSLKAGWTRCISWSLVPACGLAQASVDEWILPSLPEGLQLLYPILCPQWGWVRTRGRRSSHLLREVFITRCQIGCERQSTGTGSPPWSPDPGCWMCVCPSDTIQHWSPPGSATAASSSESMSQPHVVS